MNETIRLYGFADEASIFIDEQIRTLKRNKLNGLELRNTEFGDATKLSKNQAKEIREKLEDAGLTVWSVGSPVGKTTITDTDEIWLESFKHALEIGEILGAKKFRLFSFYIPKGEDPLPYREKVIDRLGRITDAARGSSIVLCHENEKRIYGESPERCLDLLTALPGLRAVFDPANFVQCGADALKAWEMLGPFTDYLHVKDSLSDLTIVPAGQGEGHVPEIVRDFVNRGGRDFTLEPHLYPFAGLWALEQQGDRSGISGDRYENAGKAFSEAVDAFRNVLENI